MAYEQKDNTGSLFINEKKDSPKAPFFTGTCKVDGNVWRVAGWKRESKNGKNYISLSFSVPREGGYQKKDDDGFDF